MTITKAHADYWMARKCPKFLSHLFQAKGKENSLLRVEPVSIHSLINSQTPRKLGSDPDFKNHNTLWLLRSYRRRGVLLEEMERLSKGNDQQKHGVRCERWLRKIKNSK